MCDNEQLSIFTLCDPTILRSHRKGVPQPFCGLLYKDSTIFFVPVRQTDLSCMVRGWVLVLREDWY